MNKWRYYLKFYKGLHYKLAIGVSGSLLQSAILLIIPLLVKFAIDKIIPTADLSAMTLVGIGIVGVYILNGGVTLYTRNVVLKTTKLAIQRFRDELIQKIFTLSRALYTTIDQSLLHSKIVLDTERLDIMSNALIVYFIPSVLICTSLSLFMLYTNWILFLALTATFPFLFAANRYLGRLVRKKTQIFHRSFETFSKGVLFVIQKLDLMWLQSAEQIELTNQRKKMNDLRIKSSSMALLHTTYQILQDTIVAITGIIVLVLGGIAVIRKLMTAGELISFYVALGILRSHMGTLINSLAQIIQGDISLSTLKEIVDLDRKSPYSGRKAISFSGRILLDSVSFKYDDELILNEVTLEVIPEKITVIVGPNAAGKTTIMNLILGFYRPNHGKLLAEGQRYDEIDILQLRRFIGVVTQNPLMFSGTIVENLTYGCPDVSQEDIIEFSRITTSHDFINNLPNGYDTLIGENGIRLSGGQRQRLALSRALLRNPRLLILDEPTTHLDRNMGKSLIKNLKTMPNKPTILIISHDPEVIRECHEAYHLVNGVIQDSGDPLQVLQRIRRSLKEVPVKSNRKIQG